MPAHITQRSALPPLGEVKRSHLLASLAAAIRSRGGTALLALAGTDHPVLYVRRRDRVFPVVVVQDITGGWWFVWGRTASAPASRVAEAAERLTSPAAGRRAGLKAVA